MVIATTRLIGAAACDKIASATPLRARRTAFCACDCIPRMTTSREVSALPEGFTSPAELAGIWIVAVIPVPRREKSVAQTLAGAGVGYCLPQNRIIRKDHAGRRRENWIPLFAGYLPICLTHQRDLYDILAVCSDIKSTIRVADQGRFVREIGNIVRALGSGELTPYPHLAEGVTVRVCRGPMLGVEGIIERFDKRDVLVMRIDMLGQSVAMDIDPADVEPV